MGVDAQPAGLQVVGATGGIKSRATAIYAIWYGVLCHACYAMLCCDMLQVEQVTEVPGGLMPAVHVEGLQQPLSLTLRQTQDVLQLKVRQDHQACRDICVAEYVCCLRNRVVSC